MQNAIFFPKGQNSFFLVYGSVILENEVELKVSQEYTDQNDALKCYQDIKSKYPNNSDLGIQEHIVNEVSVPQY